jgi:molecular chaperone DnaK
MGEDRPLYVGIDLGTTNSAAAVFDGSALSLIRNGQGGVLTPSVVRIDSRGSILVGSRARRFLDTDTANTRAEFKRLMGTPHKLDFPACGKQLSPEELASKILMSLRDDVADQVGVTPVRAVVSVPALFELHQTAATSEAARLAGFESIELIQEPVASAIAAGWSQENSDGSWLVYDLGGGTFDVSLLETREGMLRVVGHDGDNYLGGRDFDRALLDLVLAKFAGEGVFIDRANPGHALALRRLSFVAEEAKIELTRAHAAPFYLAGLEIGGQKVDVDLQVTRAEYEQSITPLIDRSLAICLRLLERNGILKGGLERLVLVGGPIVTPLLRKQIQTVLQAESSSGLDPMTMVAQGAALFAGTVGVNGRPAAKPSGLAMNKGPKVWLQYPAMTADLTPYVVGKLLALPSKITAIQLERDDKQWKSDPVPLETNGSFAAMVNLLSRRSTTFSVTGTCADGQRVSLEPSHFSITHGITIGDPPLARSIGVALADNTVQPYFERGAPLPIRRTFTLRTTETIHPGSEGYALKVPIVQGEFSFAHLCRLVGTLEISGSEIARPLPVGTEVEVLLELDRGGQLRASAHIADLGQSFTQIALLVTPQLSLDAVEGAMAKLQARMESLSRKSFRDRVSANAQKLSDALIGMEEIKRNFVAFRGGDLDAGEQVRRGVVDIDSILAEIENDQAWPEMAKRLEDNFAQVVALLAHFGSATERSTLNNAYQACRKALDAKLGDEVERQLNLIDHLRTAALFRSPGAWEHLLEVAASRVAESTDIRRASELVAQGRAARQQNLQAELESAVRQLWELLPANLETQILGYGSGLRQR